MSAYNKFITEQSSTFQNDTLGSEKAAKLRDGSLTLDKFENPKPITLQDFKSKRDLISGKKGEKDG